MRPIITLAVLFATASSTLALPAPFAQVDVRPIIEHEYPHIAVHYATSGFRKRQDGGNAVSGNSGDVSGGDVINEGGGDGTITNDGSCEYPLNTAARQSLIILIATGGTGGTTTSGDATGGESFGFGNGGSAFTGDAGAAEGGSVINDGGSVDNTDGGSAGGTGGTSTSGTAQGGDGGNGFEDFDDFEGYD